MLDGRRGLLRQGRRKRHCRGTRAGHRVQPRRHRDSRVEVGRPAAAESSGGAAARCLLEPSRLAAGELTQPEWRPMRTSGSRGGGELDECDIETGPSDVADDQSSRQSGGRNIRSPERRVTAPPPPERACDAGEGISVRVERRPGPLPCGGRPLRLAERGGDSRCLARPTRLTERQTSQIRGQDAAPAARAETCGSRPGNGISSGRPLGRNTGAPLRIGHLNVRSLLPSIDDVNVALGTLNLDLLCISETWLSLEIADSFSGYFRAIKWPCAIAPVDGGVEAYAFCIGTFSGWIGCRYLMGIQLSSRYG